MIGKTERGNPIVHTKILFHWTMKKGKTYDLSDYKARLKDILNVGLRFGEVEEKFSLRGHELKPTKTKMLCFTETRMSNTLTGQQDNVTWRYGDLGIGLHRKYVVRNGGNPVFYVNAMDSANIESLMERSEELKWFVKPMNDFDTETTFNWDEYGLYNYDDLEWRIIPQMKKCLVGTGQSTTSSALESYMVKEKNSEIYLELMKSAPCIECIVFPNEETQEYCMDTIFAFFDKTNYPLVTTQNRLKHI